MKLQCVLSVMASAAVLGDGGRTYYTKAAGMDPALLVDISLAMRAVAAPRCVINTRNAKWIAGQLHWLGNDVRAHPKYQKSVPSDWFGHGGRPVRLVELDAMTI